MSNFYALDNTTHVALDVAQIILTCCLIDPSKFLSHLSPIFNWLSHTSL